MATTKLSATVFAVVAVLALFQSSAAQTTHVVGDTVGWGIPPNPTTYATWAASQKFAVGDVLVFNYPTGAHDVAQVTKAAYDGCGSTNPILMITTGPARITLNASGDHYYVCTFPGHCGTGQKLSINVPARAATPPPTPATAMPPAASPPTPTTSMPPAASPPTPTTSMPPAASPPTPTTSMPPASSPTPITPALTPSPATMSSPPSPSPTDATSPSGMATPPSGMETPSPTDAPAPGPSTGSPPPPGNNSPSTLAGVAALPAALLSIALVLFN